MRKFFYFAMLIVLCIGCSFGQGTKKKSMKDSMVMVFGFKDMSCKDSVIIPYDSFKLYKDSFAPLYDVESNQIIFVRSKSRYEYGDYKVTSNNDTIFYVGEDIVGKYDIGGGFVSARVWHREFEQYKEKILSWENPFLTEREDM